MIPSDLDIQRAQGKEWEYQRLWCVPLLGYLLTETGINRFVDARMSAIDELLNLR